MRDSSPFTKFIAKLAKMAADQAGTWRAAFTKKSPRVTIRGELQKMVAEAETGDVDAIYVLGMAYRNRVPEIEIERQSETAFEWISKAANLGHPDAQHRLALMYWRGEGTTKSKSNALAWCQIAGREPKDVIGNKSAWKRQMSAREIKKAKQLRSALVIFLPVIPRAAINYKLASIGRPFKTHLE